MTDTAPGQPPMGVTITIGVGAIVAGAAFAELLYDAASLLHWLTAAGLCAGLYGVGRLFARSAPTRGRALVLVALGCLTFSYLMVLGGEAMPRPFNRDATGFLAFFFLLLGVLGAAVALPVVLVAAALRSRRHADSPRIGFQITPARVMLALGVGMYLLGLFLFGLAMWASPRQWRLVAMVAAGLGGPALLLPFWTHAYQRLLSRWAVPQAPRALLEGLETLRCRTGFEFRRVLCLESRFGSGRICQVVSALGRSTLIVSESIPAELTAEQLLAVLAHEAAHVRLHHFRRKLAWGMLGGIVAVATSVGVGMLLYPFVPRRLGFAGVLVAVLPVTLARGLYDTFVVRRHEAEADEFAVDVAGGTALLDALVALGGSGQREAIVHNRWTTHGTWERRASRIRELDKARGSLGSAGADLE